ncbi:hypothetical protein A9Q90_04235 [Gammaproteobacteria bacterium 54_18_T64]|nr:hypothetical protein A9Q90_04235 [Gammaproteobacteria bacterium 54_18_T64]
MIEGLTNTPTGPERLKAYEDNWQTEMGAWFPGERVVLRGKDVFSELSNQSWMEFMVFAITGRDMSEFARVIEAMWLISSSFPDPRLWNNRVAALAGTARSTTALAAAAGNAVSEASIYGLRTSRGALDFLQRTEKKLNEGATLEDIIKKELHTYRAIYGYGRPLINIDERIKPLLKFAYSAGYKKNTLLILAFKIHDYFQTTKYKFQINISAIVAAISGDYGLTLNEFNDLAALSFSGGIFPCYIDARNNPEGSLFPLGVERILSTDQTTRTWKSEE